MPGSKRSDSSSQKAPSDGSGGEAVSHDETVTSDVQLERGNIYVYYNVVDDDDGLSERLAQSSFGGLTRRQRQRQRWGLKEEGVAEDAREMDLDDVDGMMQIEQLRIYDPGCQRLHNVKLHSYY